MTGTSIPPAMGGGALAGMKVVDLSRVLAGPFCTQILGDHGAEVIKVEPPQKDETRSWGAAAAPGQSAYYMGVNRNKRDIALDLRQEAAREIVMRLLEDADIVIENFKPGTMEKWGMGYEEVLARRFPRLIHCRITGFGGDGPYGGYPGYDAVVQAMAGVMSINGAPETGPLRVGIPMVDLATGLNAAIGLLLAVAERERSGHGQFLEVTLFDTALSVMHPHAANWFIAGREPRLTGNPHPNVAPYEKYTTATGDIFVGIGNDSQFRRLCAELDAPKLAGDPRFTTNNDRLENRAALIDALSALLSDIDGIALCDRLLAKNIPAGPVNSVPSVLAHPHAAHREMVVTLDGYRGTGIPIKLSRTPGSVRTQPPRFGENNRDILRQAGYDDKEIDDFIAEGIVLEDKAPTAKPKD